jgi:hypothetical protein
MVRDKSAHYGNNPRHCALILAIRCSQSSLLCWLRGSSREEHRPYLCNDDGEVVDDSLSLLPARPSKVSEPVEGEL